MTDTPKPPPTPVPSAVDQPSETKPRFRAIWLLALATVLVIGGAVWLYAQPQSSIGAPTVTPSVVGVNTPTTVTVTTAITGRSPVPNGVELLRVDQNRDLVSSLGRMRDDGRSGDQQARDGIWTMQVQFNEPATNEILLQVAAKFPGPFLGKPSQPGPPPRGPALGHAFPSPPWRFSSRSLINVWERFEQGDLSFAIYVPPLGRPLSLVVDPVTSNDLNGYLDVQIERQGMHSSALGLVIYQNTGGYDLDGWFHNNIDPDSILRSSGAFQLVRLPNGFDAYVRSGPVPSAYQRGPVQHAYAMSRLSARVLSVASAQEGVLTDLGFSREGIQNLLLQIVGTAEF